MPLIDIIMSINFKTPFEMSQLIAKRAKAQRLVLNLSQRTLSERSGVSYGTLKKFERTGQISLESLLKIALVLKSFDAFDTLFVNNKLPLTLDELMAESTRKRGRR